MHFQQEEGAIFSEYFEYRCTNINVKIGELYIEYIAQCLLNTRFRVSGGARFDLVGLIFVKIVFIRTKGEEIKLTDDDLDDIDNGDDGKMADDDGDEDEGVICHTIIQRRHLGDVGCCSPNKRPIRVMIQQ